MSIDLSGVVEGSDLWNIGVRINELDEKVKQLKDKGIDPKADKDLVEEAESLIEEFRTSLQAQEEAALKVVKKLEDELK